MVSLPEPPEQRVAAPLGADEDVVAGAADE